MWVEYIYFANYIARTRRYNTERPLDGALYKVIFTYQYQTRNANTTVALFTLPSKFFLIG